MTNRFFGYSAVLDAERRGDTFDPLAPLSIHPTPEDALRSRHDGNATPTVLTTNADEYFHVWHWRTIAGQGAEPSAQHPDADGEKFQHYSHAYAFAEWQGRDGGLAKITLMTPTREKVLVQVPGCDPVSVGETVNWLESPLSSRISLRPTYDLSAMSTQDKIDQLASQRDWDRYEGPEDGRYVTYHKGGHQLWAHYSFDGKLLLASVAGVMIPTDRAKHVMRELRSR